MNPVYAKETPPEAMTDNKMSQSCKNIGNFTIHKTSKTYFVFVIFV